MKKPNNVLGLRLFCRNELKADVQDGSVITGRVCLQFFLHVKVTTDLRGV